jgi:hypothetical protein
VTYRVASEFDRVYQASRDWEFTKTRLGHQRDFADALGLTSDTTRRVLEIPPPAPGTDSAAFPGERLKQLADDTAVSLADWSVANFPEPGRALLATRLRESIGNGAKHARKLIGQKFVADTPEGWRVLAERLNDPAIRDWGRLLQLLLKLEDSQAADPVTELAGFLRAERFTFDLKGFELALPLSLRVPAIVAAGPLAITVVPPGGPPIVQSFKLAGEGMSEGLNTLYRFAPEKPEPFSLTPGDGFKVELPVRSGDQRFTLTWDDSATRTYPFDRLSREPKLVFATGDTEPATGVVLAPAFGSKVPRLPLLLPDVKR